MWTHVIVIIRPNIQVISSILVGSLLSSPSQHPSSLPWVTLVLTFFLTDLYFQFVKLWNHEVCTPGVYSLLVNTGSTHVAEYRRGSFCYGWVLICVCLNHFWTIDVHLGCVCFLCIMTTRLLEEVLLSLMIWSTSLRFIILILNSSSLPLQVSDFLIVLIQGYGVRKGSN